MTVKDKWDCLVVGAGPAGCMAAIMAASQGQRVILLEKNWKIGKKLYITGKGRCNLTNALGPDGILASIPHNSKFLYGAIHAFPSHRLMAFFEKAGCPLKVERGNRVFPQSDKSSHIIQTLEGQLNQKGVLIRKGSRVKSLLFAEVGLEKSDNIKARLKGVEAKQKVVGLELAQGEKIYAHRTILALGGLAYPATGSTGDGYRLAAMGGHTIVQLAAGLVPIETVERDFTGLAPLVLKNVGLQVKAGSKVLYQGQGEVQFTGFGLSGALVLSASSYLPKEIGQDIQASIDLKPALTYDQLDRRILREISEGANLAIKDALGSLLPVKMLALVLARCQINPEKKGGEMKKKDRISLIQCLKALNFQVRGVRPMKEAIITRGGINVKEINPKTMESKLVKDLYIVGEMLDIDGLTGGFNLQMAFSTGYVAGIQPVKTL